MDAGSRRYAKLFAKAWVDPEFHARLKADPKKVLHEEGFHTGHTVSIHEDTNDHTHFVLPVRPKHLKDEDLKKSEPHPDLCCTVCI